MDRLLYSFEKEAFSAAILAQNYVDFVEAGQSEWSSVFDIHRMILPHFPWLYQLETGYSRWYLALVQAPAPRMSGAWQCGPVVRHIVAGALWQSPDPRRYSQA